MGFKSTNEGVAASIYLALYTIYLIAAGSIVYREGWKSIYVFFLTFGILRTAGQLCGVAFSVLGFDHWQWLIAYLVFTAEGYFVLILSTFHFAARAQTLEFGTSWIRPTSAEIKAKQAGLTGWRKQIAWYSLARVFHLVLIPANAIIIAGGSMLAGIDPDQFAENHNKIITSRVLRTVGQAIFLCQTAFAIGMAFYVAIYERLSRYYQIRSVFLAAPFILVRGIFGVLSIYIQKMNYFDLSNYTSDGLSSQFVTYEYVLATTMEFVAASIYIGVYWFEKYRRPAYLLNQHTEVVHESDGTVDPEKEKEV